LLRHCKTLAASVLQVNTYPTVRGFTAIGTGGDDFVQSMVVAVESVIEERIPEVGLFSVFAITFVKLQPLMILVHLLGFEVLIVFAHIIILKVITYTSTCENCQ